MPGPQINTLTRIDAIYAAISVDDDGTEGICGFLSTTGWLPLITADPKNLHFIREQAEFIAKRDQRLVRIVKLTTREEVELVDGRQ